MRSACLFLLLAAGCSTTDPFFGADAPSVIAGAGGSGGATSSATGSGGAGGSGGAAVGTGGTGGASSTSSAGGAPGTGGAGGDVGTGGQGGSGGACAVDHDAICAALPGGACGDVDDGCGGTTYCGNEACGNGALTCDPAMGGCICQTLDSFGFAVNACNALGLGPPYNCGHEPDADVPANCTMTDVDADFGGNKVWCC